jgi:hypothetical protein
MKSGTTFRGQAKPMGKSGHFYEPRRHSLQAKGFKTGTHSGMPLYMKDTDRDGVPDKFDCNPYNPKEQDGSKEFKIDDHISIVARYGDSRDGFNHFATLYIDGVEMGTTKAHYINRTWESYEYQSVMQDLVNKNKSLTPEQKAKAQEYLKKDHTDWSGFKSTAMIAKLGDIMTSNKKESNDWKARMIKAGLGNKGLEMPEDWDKLDEETKEARLNSVIALMNESGHKEDTNAPARGEPPTTPRNEPEHNLEPRYDGRASFYGKAQVRTEAGKEILTSYNTDVAYIKDGKAVVNGAYSDTTLRHIKEFLKQNGFKAEHKDQILKDYGKKEE